MSSGGKNLVGKFFSAWRRVGFLTALDYSRQYLQRAVIKCVFSPRLTRPGRISLLGRLSPVPARARARALELIGDRFDHRHDISGRFTVLKGGGMTLAGREVVLLAHWDPQDRVDEYVAYLGRHFRSLGKTVVLCTACPVDAGDKCLDFADAVVFRRCDGYDFTSWKAAAAAFPDIFSADELTLCNDSVFAPVGSYGPVYEAMAAVDCDFWGMVPSWQLMPHLQSYHIVFKRSALGSPALRQFFAAIPASASRKDAISLELRLALWLELAGLTPGVFVRFMFFGPSNPTHDMWRHILQCGCPILKRELLNEAGTLTGMRHWYTTLNESGYPIDLILRYYYRLGRDISSISCYGERRDDCPPNIMVRQAPVSLPEGAPATHDIAIVAHCYYERGFGLLSPYLANVPKNAVLYISTDTEAKADYLRAEAAVLGFAGTCVRVLPNAGWDIGPFVAGFRDALLRHELILKVHVKMSTNTESHWVKIWRDLLYDSLMGSKSHVNGILRQLEENPRLGLLAPPTFQAISEVSQKYNARNMKKILRHFNFQLSPRDAIDFPVGSMFWARQAALRPLLDIGLDFRDFEKTDPSRRDGTFAHAVERSFFYSCHAAGLDWGRVPPPPYTALAPVLTRDSERTR